MDSKINMGCCLTSHFSPRLPRRIQWINSTRNTSVVFVLWVKPTKLHLPFLWRYINTWPELADNVIFVTGLQSPNIPSCGGLLFAQWWHFDTVFKEGRCSSVCLFAMTHKVNGDLNPNYFQSSRVPHFYYDENFNTEDPWLILSVWYMVVLNSCQPLKELSHGCWGGVTPQVSPKYKNSRQQEALYTRQCGRYTDLTFSGYGY